MRRGSRKGEKEKEVEFGEACRAGEGDGRGGLGKGARGGDCEAAWIS